MRRRMSFGALTAIAVAVAAALVVALSSGDRASTEVVQAPALAAPAAQSGTVAANMEWFEAPEMAPDTAFFDAEGNERSLADYRGKVVLLNLWATWCAPCIREMPDLDALEAELGGDDFAVLPVSLDRGGVAQIEAFYARTEIEHLPMLSDPKAKLSSALAVPGLPETFLIDREGRIVARHRGPAKWDGEEAVQMIEQVISAAHLEEPV